MSPASAAITARLKLIQKVRPALHHHSALFDEFGSVVGCAKCIGNTVCKLVFNEFRGEAKFLMEDRSRHRAKAMPCNFGLGVVPHATQRGVDRGVTHRFLRVAPWEDVQSLPGQGMKLAQDGDCLRRQRHKMLRLGLCYQITPLARIQVDFLPQCFSQFTGAHEKLRRQMKGALNNECSPKAVDGAK
jgi:hypothetical protein